MLLNVSNRVHEQFNLVLCYKKVISLSFFTFFVNIFETGIKKIFWENFLFPIYFMFPMKFSGFIFDINMDNPTQFCEVSIPKCCIFQNRDQARYVKKIFWFRASLCIHTSGKNLMIIPFVVPEIPGRVVPPPRCH